MLPVDWWIKWRDEEPVQAALVQSHCVFWTGLVDEILLRNEREGTSPSTWRELALHLCRHPKNFDRWRYGKQFNYAPHAFLSLASTLGLEVSEFMPSNLQWVAAAVRVLCSNGFTPEHCRLFAACCFQQPDAEQLDISLDSLRAAQDLCRCSHDPEVVLEVLSEMQEVLQQQLKHLME